MAIFAIIQQPDPNSAKLQPAIERVYPDSSYQLSPGVWMVSDVSHAKGVSDKLQITGGENGQAVVLEVGSYYGRGNPGIWTWMQTRWEGLPNG